MRNPTELEMTASKQERPKTNSDPEPNGPGKAGGTFQNRVEEWLEACFPKSATVDRAERTFRFLEEAIELAQANGCSKEEANMLLTYVYSREKGEPDQEVGGVMVTLAGLCSTSSLNMHDAGDKELKRNWDRIDIIRKKQATKPPGSPLPQ